MLLLKGYGYKGLIVDAMQARGHVCVVEYSDYFEMYDTFGISAKEYGIDELIEAIESINKDILEDTVVNNKRRPMFFVIYTDKKQEDLADLIKWIEDNERNLNCSQTLLCCL